MHPKIEQVFQKYKEIAETAFRQDRYGCKVAFESKNYIAVPRNEGFIIQGEEFRNSVECRRLSYRLGTELEEQGFSVKYCVALNGNHHFIQVFDNNRWISLDAAQSLFGVSLKPEAFYNKNFEPLDVVFLEQSKCHSLLITKRNDLFYDIGIAAGYDASKGPSSLELLLQSLAYEGYTRRKIDCIGVIFRIPNFPAVKTYLLTKIGFPPLQIMWGLNDKVHIEVVDIEKRLARDKTVSLKGDEVIAGLQGLNEIRTRNRRKENAALLIEQNYSPLLNFLKHITILRR